MRAFSQLAVTIMAALSWPRAVLSRPLLATGTIAEYSTSCTAEPSPNGDTTYYKVHVGAAFNHESCMSAKSAIESSKVANFHCAASEPGNTVLTFLDLNPNGTALNAKLQQAWPNITFHCPIARGENDPDTARSTATSLQSSSKKANDTDIWPSIARNTQSCTLVNKSVYATFADQAGTSYTVHIGAPFDSAYCSTVHFNLESNMDGVSRFSCRNDGHNNYIIKFDNFISYLAETNRVLDHMFPSVKGFSCSAHERAG